MRELAAFYAVAALFGFIYAGTMPLYSVLVRENFPLRMMGTVIGGTAMAGSLGMATGPLAGGLIYDTFASYAWLYIGSWAVGLGAFLIAMTFRPFPEGCDAARADAGVKPNGARATNGVCNFRSGGEIVNELACIHFKRDVLSAMVFD